MASRYRHPPFRARTRPHPTSHAGRGRLLASLWRSRRSLRGSLTLYGLADLLLLWIAAGRWEIVDLIDVRLPPRLPVFR